MGVADCIILAAITVSVLLGLWRGLLAEVLALAVWFAALWAAWQFGAAFSVHLPARLSDPAARLFVAWAAIFILVLIAGALLAALLRMLVRGTGLTGTDRMLGMLFGAARGVLIVTLAVLLAGMTPLPREPWWRRSALLPDFQRAAQTLQAHLPPQVARYVSYAAYPPARWRLPQPLPAAPHPPSSEH